ncbi:MAG: hypothetical protein K0Q57_1045 [Gammaproteobacteria bacterium]|jgi:hypothetical protein|nr:hypothetical protein [Gammaproteobacteria bacterium]
MFHLKDYESRRNAWTYLVCSLGLIGGSAGLGYGVEWRLSKNAACAEAHQLQCVPPVQNISCPHSFNTTCSFKKTKEVMAVYNNNMELKSLYPLYTALGGLGLILLIGLAIAGYKYYKKQQPKQDAYKLLPDKKFELKTLPTPEGC